MSGEIIGAAVLGTAAVGAAVFTGAAITLFNRVIPRQNELRVDISEMADMATWEEYKKKIAPRAEWVYSQALEKVNVTARDGIRLNAYFLKAEGESKGVVICHHGYTSKALDNSAIAVFFHELGYDVLMADNRAHGESEGKYVGFGILDRYDCLEWIKLMDKRYEGKKDILLYGISMGATTVLMASSLPGLPKSVKAIISDCAFTSPYDVFSHILKRDYHLPKFPVMNINDAICRKKAGYGFKDYSTLDAVKSTTVPILFIHGKSDNFVPSWMTEENYKECTAPKDILFVDNAGHGASYYENTEQYEAKVKEFLSKYVPEN